jgi:hypothetical protein
MDLNAKIADTLRTMPEHKEMAFATVHSEQIHLPLFVMRHGVVPDNSYQVYSFNKGSLDQLASRLLPEEKAVLGAFDYTLCVSPMSPRRLFALLLSCTTPRGVDPIVLLHAPEFAKHTDGTMVLHFVDEPSMRAFASALE